MRLRDDNPILDLLRDGQMPYRMPPEGEDFHPQVGRLLADYRAQPAKGVLLSPTFQQALQRAAPSLQDAFFAGLAPLEHPFYGVLFTTTPKTLLAYVCDLRRGSTGKANGESFIEGRILLLVNRKNSPQVGAAAYLEADVEQLADATVDVRIDGFYVDGRPGAGAGGSVVVVTPGVDEHLLNAMYISVCTSLLYMSYGEIDTKYVHNERVKIAQREVVERIDYPITYVRSSWLQHIVRQEGFDVRGHFRWQRRGRGRTERVLTWVKGHRRKGYSRVADRWRVDPTPPTAPDEQPEEDQPGA